MEHENETVPGLTDEQIFKMWSEVADGAEIKMAGFCLGSNDAARNLQPFVFARAIIAHVAAQPAPDSAMGRIAALEAALAYAICEADERCDDEHGHPVIGAKMDSARAVLSNVSVQPAPALTPEQERAAFEAWYGPDFLAFKERAWSAWQARAALGSQA